MSVLFHQLILSFERWNTSKFEKCINCMFRNQPAWCESLSMSPLEPEWKVMWLFWNFDTTPLNISMRCGAQFLFFESDEGVLFLEQKQWNIQGQLRRHGTKNEVTNILVAWLIKILTSGLPSKRLQGVTKPEPWNGLDFNNLFSRYKVRPLIRWIQGFPVWSKEVRWAIGFRNRKTKTCFCPMHNGFGCFLWYFSQAVCKRKPARCWLRNPAVPWWGSRPISLVQFGTFSFFVGFCGIRSSLQEIASRYLDISLTKTLRITEQRLYPHWSAITICVEITIYFSGAADSTTT